MMWTDGEEPKGGIVFGKAWKITTLGNIEDDRFKVKPKHYRLWS